MIFSDQCKISYPANIPARRQLMVLTNKISKTFNLNTTLNKKRLNDVSANLLYTLKYLWNHYGCWALCRTVRITNSSIRCHEISEQYWHREQIKLTFSCIMLKNGQTYSKNLAVWTFFNIKHERFQANLLIFLFCIGTKTLSALPTANTSRQIMTRNRNQLLMKRILTITTSSKAIK